MRGNLRTLALVTFLAGCGGSASAPVAPFPPPPPPALTALGAITPSSDGAVAINGLMTCRSAAGVLSGCALDEGATLDDLANSLLRETDLTEAH